MGQVHTLKSELEGLKSSIAEYRQQIVELKSAGISDKEWPRLTRSSQMAAIDEFTAFTVNTNTSSRPSLASSELAKSSELRYQEVKAKKTAMKPIIGSALRNKSNLLPPLGM